MDLDRVTGSGIVDQRSDLTPKWGAPTSNEPKQTRPRIAHRPAAVRCVRNGEDVASVHSQPSWAPKPFPELRRHLVCAPKAPSLHGMMDVVEFALS